jgi:hypothetical protein
MLCSIAKRQGVPFRGWAAVHFVQVYQNLFLFEFQTRDNWLQQDASYVTQLTVLTQGSSRRRVESLS